MTATIKEFCRINNIPCDTDNLTEVIYEALIGGDCDGGSDTDCGEEPQSKAPIPDGIA